MNAIIVADPKSTFNTFKLKGIIQFSQQHPNDLTFVKVSLQNFPKNGSFGFHVHQYGDLTDGCTSTCNHFNPYDRKHGSLGLHSVDRHVGDLAVPGGNLNSDKNGNVVISFYDDLISLYPNERCIIGRSIVIHQNPDDLGRYRNINTPEGIESGKTGNAGKRIFCAIIGIARNIPKC
jgi:Cu-Zn family superoxide dismutase